MSELRDIAHGRLGRRNMLILFGLGFGLIVGVGAVIAALAARGVGAPCQPYRPCGPPSKTPLVDFQLWRSSRFGFAFAYPAGPLSIVKQGPAGVVLKINDGKGALIVTGRPAAAGSTSDAVTHEANSLSQKLSAFSADSKPQDAILGANVGYRPGSWGAYVGTLANAQGPSQTTNVAIQSASDGKVTITATALDFTNSARKSEAYAAADLIFDTIQWAP